MPPAFRRTAPAVLLALLVPFASAFAAQVSNLSVLVRNGQTFVSWTCPPGLGWLYRVYVSSDPIRSTSDLQRATVVGTAQDSTWYDRRLSVLTGTTYGFRVDPSTPPLTSDKALVVLTSTGDRYSYYAVTSQSDMLTPEDRSIVAGQNSTKKYVHEYLRTPEPSFQRTITWTGVNADIYTLWTSDVATPLFPLMGNRPGLAFDCAIVPPRVPSALTSSLMVLPHRKGGSFLECLVGTGMPGEWVLALDDPTMNSDANTFWYGYHEDYDITSDANAPPVYGYVHDYTLQRILHTLGWARSSFPVDTTQVYAYGYSMGGIGSAMLAFNRPRWIAGIMSVVGKYDFSFVNDPNPTSSFNFGQPLRDLSNRLWGDVNLNLPTCYGDPIYQALDDGAMAHSLYAEAVPPILSYNGKWDTTVGWAEKIPFYSAMRDARQGGMFFWDQRDHMGTATSTWGPAQDPLYLYRFRTNRSFPAISNCSLDGNPGDGDPLSGDSVGTINGFVEWDTSPLDQPSHWGITLSLRSLNQRGGTANAPDVATADVTPRRLQAFQIVEGVTFQYTVTRVSDGAVVQQGTIQANVGDPLTVPGVQIYRTGSRLDIQALGSAGVDLAASSPRMQLRMVDNPVVRGSAIVLNWPVSGEARVELLDVAGRRIRTLFAGAVTAGPARLGFSSSGLTSGVYLVSARCGSQSAIGRAVVLH